jgi:DNA repair exonuclease SbcCD nuclease subunit
MSEHTETILRRFSALEWERAELLGSTIPPHGLAAIQSYVAEQHQESADYVIKGHTRRRGVRSSPLSVPCMLVRGAIEVRAQSIRQVAARLRVNWTTVRSGLKSGRTIKGWRVRKAA